MNEPSSKPNWLLPAASLWRREIVRFVRQRSRVIGALGTPIVFWLLIGSGLGRSFALPAASESNGAPVHYLEYFFPGTMVLIVLFTAIFSTISIIEDRREGFLQAVVAAPIPRSAIVFGKTLGSTTLAVVQALLFMAFAPAAGVTLTFGSVVLLAITLIVLGIGLSGLGFLIAWPMDSTQGFHAIMNLFLFPMWFLSGALFPKVGASSWIGWIMTANPLTYGVAAVRRALYGEMSNGSLPSYGVSMVVTAAFAVAMITVSAWMVGRRDSK